MKTLILAVLILATGCAALGSPASVYQDMTAEQIKAAVSDKSSSIICTHGVYAGATITVLAVNADKAIPAGITVTEKCATTMNQRIKDATEPQR